MSTRRVVRIGTGRAGQRLELLVNGIAYSTLHAQPSTETTRGPILLQRPQLLSPIETTGSGLEPEVRLRIEVDTRR